MNRKVLGLAITALLAANAANAAEIYNKDGNKVDLTGKVEAAYTFRGDSTPKFDGWRNPVMDTGTNKIHNEDGTMARLGFVGETQINSELTGYAKFEHQFTSHGQESNADVDDGTRYAYVGLKFANYGSIDFGRNYGVVGLVRDFSDNAMKFGGDGFGGGTDVFMTGRASSLVTYSNHDFFGMVPGWNFYLQYQAKDTLNDHDFEKQHGDGLAFTTTYEHADTGLGFGFTYSKSDRTDEQQDAGREWAFRHNTYAYLDANNPLHDHYTRAVGRSADGNNAEIWGLGAKYDANNIYFGITYAETKNMIGVGNDSYIWAYRDAYAIAADGSLIKSGEFSDSYEIANRTKGLEIVANYTFDFGLTPSIVYNQQRGYDLHGFEPTAFNTTGQGSSYLVKYLGLGAKYAFNKNIDAAIGYKFNMLDEDSEYIRRHGIATDDTVEMRLTYSF